MDLKHFLDSDDEALKRLRTKVGLYIVSPSGYENKYRDIFRCGAAGVGVYAGVDTPYKSRSADFKTRFQMYHNAWLGSGVVYAVLVVH
eukprot:802862-Pleurochrysis_carterae.AAC.1